MGQTMDDIIRSREETSKEIESLLNDAFRYTEGFHPVYKQQRNKLRDTIRYRGPHATIEVAARAWLAEEVEQYAGLLTKRKIVKIKVWKNFDNDGMLDVYLRIAAEGRAQKEFDLKVYVELKQSDDAVFKLEDWSQGINGNVNGRLNRSGGFQFNETAVQGNPPPGRLRWYWDDEKATA
jgi:hypothetical protein